ncbi:UNVERIFIED_CONTAM: hypothetical protein Slati_3673000 [Sesamum latifolium]|uniref:Zinc knuckle CX2CX4HX4C domain-containing protein n=1 Tax=Sesamum latifolium TaxID=2727402 RepID=A0AAW2U1F4_9LAMI
MNVSTATLVQPSVARVCVEINLLEPLQTEIGLGFGTEMFIQPLLYERLPKYCGTCRYLGHDEEECYEKHKMKPVRLVDGQGASATATAPAREDPRVKLDAQWERRDLNNRKRGKHVVFEVSEARSHPEASASGSKRDGEEMHDEEFCNDALETVMKEVRKSMGVVDGGKEGPSYDLHSTPEDVHQEGRTRSEMGRTVHEESAFEPEVQGLVGPAEMRLDIMQATAMAHDELPRCVQNTSDQDFSYLAAEAEDVIIVPTGEGVIRQMRKRGLGGWHATGVVDPWGMSLRVSRFLQFVGRRYPLHVESSRGVQ